MPSNREARRQPGQAGFGLVEVLVASALLGVALVVLLGSLSSLLIGSRIAERRTAEARIARNTLETLMAEAIPVCPSSRPPELVGSYTVKIRIECPRPFLIEYTVRVSDASGSAFSLSVDRADLRGGE